MLSVDAVQLRVTVVPDAEPVSWVGAVGGLVSAWHCGGVIVTVVLACDTLPAASRALTYRPQVAPGDHGEARWTAWCRSPTSSAGRRGRCRRRRRRRCRSRRSRRTSPSCSVRLLTRALPGAVGGWVSALPAAVVHSGWSARCRSTARPAVLFAVPVAGHVQAQARTARPTMVPSALIRPALVGAAVCRCRSAAAAGAVVSWPATSRHIVSS